MGNSENKLSTNPEVYYLDQYHVRTMNEIFKFIETDLVHYGTQFYTVLFKNHPDYLKYFQESEPHEFQADVPAMHTKFCLTCSTLAALFIDYAHKPRSRDHLLEYVAMVHKDMNLTEKDLNNFMIDMMEMLMNQFPKLMRAECYLAYMKYTESLTQNINMLMIHFRDGRISRRSNRKFKDRIAECFGLSHCDWLPCSSQNLIYGRPAEYWNLKRHHWLVRRAVWATIEGEKSSDLTRKEKKSNTSIVTISQLSISEENSSDEEQWINHQINKNKIRSIGDKKMMNKNKNKNFKPRQFRRRKNFSAIFSKNGSTDTENEKITKSNDRHSDTEERYLRSQKFDRGRFRHVSIFGSSARERRRQTLQEDVNSDDEHSYQVTRRLTIQSEKTDNDSFSSDNAEEIINFRLGLVSPETDKRRRDRGTSISNVSDQFNTVRKNDLTEGTSRSFVNQKPQTSVSIKNYPRTSIISSTNSAGRSNKVNKRVSISSAHWYNSKDFEK